MLEAVADLTNPTESSSNRKPRGTYVIYTDEDRARLGRYASVNGNERARKHFLSEYPKLSESTIRNFKKMYLNKRNAIPNPVTKLPVQ